jgi:hypothetical protein
MAQEIFKICHLKDNKIYKIDVFNGDTKHIGQNIKDIYTSDINILNNFFDEEEKKTILDNSIDVFYHEIYIYIDDTIETIKKKLISTNNVAFEEIYFFYTYTKNLTSYEIYSNLTQNNKLPLTKSFFIQFLLNTNQETLLDTIPDKAEYSYNDILELKLDDKDLLINTPLGQSMSYYSNLYPITANPFTTLIFNDDSKFISDLIKTNNKSLLLDNNLKTINKNIIYCCTANNVVDYIAREKLSDQECIKLYYPYLVKLEILSLSVLTEKSPMLISKSKEMIDENFERNNNNIALFNDIYNEKTSELKYNNKGINKLEFTIKPIIAYTIPIDIIFKTLHADKNMPLIKFNPSKKMENLYRLYSDKISTKGTKIPFLSKSKIFKFMKTIGTSKSVTCYITYDYEDTIIPILCKFSPDTSITISLDIEKPLTIEAINNIIIDAVNPIINIVKSKLEESGYQITLFNGIGKDNIEIIDLTYSLSIDITHNININSNIGCISSIFNIEQSNLRKGIFMRFKRITNFSEMDSIEAFILDFYKKEDVTPEEIIQGLVEYFRMSESAARARVAEVLRSTEVVKTLYKSKQIRNKNNPGFLTKIELENFSSTANISVSGINNINYLLTIPLYLDSLLRITQNPDSTGVSQEIINQLCLKKEIIEKEVIKEIEAIESEIKDVGELDIDTIDKPGNLFTQPVEIGKDDEDDYDEDLQKTFFASDDEDDDDDDEQDGGADIELGSSVGSSPKGSPGIALGSSVGSSPKDSPGIALGSSVGSSSKDSPGIALGSSVGSSPKDSPGIALGSSVGSSPKDSPGIALGSSVGLSPKDTDIALGSLVGLSPKDSPGIALGSSVGLSPKDTDIALGSSVGSSPNKSEEIELLEDLLEKTLSENKEINKEIVSKEKDIAEEEEEIVLNEKDIPEEEEEEVALENKDVTKEDEKEKTLNPFKSILVTKTKPAPKKAVQLQEPSKPKLVIQPVTEKPKQVSKLSIKPNITTEGNVLKRDITGMSLSNPNPFEDRLKKRAPKLFTYDLGGKYSGYNRICPSNVRRQPVILTDSEKEKIDKDHPDSYKHAINYGIPGGEKFWYICPRYWSLKDNTSLTEEEVKSGKYGNVIPFKGKDGKPIKSVPENTSIFEFNAPSEHMKQGKYVEHYPGFIQSDSHPSGYCLPCCFKQWDSKEQKRRREQCLDKEEGLPIVQPDKTVKDDYIKGAEKFPIQPKRMGFLPLVIQRFLRTDNQKCQVSASNVSLKPNHVCLLRQGVEFSRNKSFIACIADVYSSVTKQKTILISQMQDILANSIDLDRFATLQNGSLINVFYKENNSIVLDEYKETILYEKTDLTNENQKLALLKIISAYINFKQFLLSENELIDYTYLWDLICKNNDKLFLQGLNLIILELLENDMTDNINIICPTNHFSNQNFDVNKKTLLLIKNNEYFEPIYLFEDKGSILNIQRLFNLNDPNILPDLKDAIISITKIIQKNCMSLPSIPDIYTFQQNISLVEIIKRLKDTNYKITNQVLNYNGKVIGILVVKDVSEKNFVPCFPSNIIVDLGSDILWIDDVFWNSYEMTKIFLEELNRETNGGILSLPKIKVIEEELIVGIITETNQFVAVIPEPNISEDNLEILDHSDFIVADRVSLLSQEKDKERITLIKNIKLEKNFYDSFRNTIRILLGNPENSEIRQKLQNLIEDKNLVYFKKLELIEQTLRLLTVDAIKFILYSDSLIDQIDEISSCIVKDEEQCRKNNYCLLSEGNKCSLLIPKNNLLTGFDNEIQYFGKIADELIRYYRIKKFIFEPQTFLTFSSVKYNLRENELLIIQSLLNQEYFTDLIPLKDSKFSDITSYDTINPNISTKYVPIINLTEEELVEELPKESVIKSVKSFKIIPSTSKIKSVIFGNLPTELTLPELPELEQPELEQPELEQPELKQPELEQPEIEQPELEQPELEQPEVEQPELEQPEVEQPELEQPELEQPEVEQPEVEQPEVKTKTQLKDKDLSESKINFTSFINCKKEQKVLTDKWKNLFIKGVNSITYTNISPFCSFQLIIEIITNFNPAINITSINKLKEILLSQYETYRLDTYRIGNIWKQQGKKEIAEKLLLGSITLETAIMNETYYISNLDILLLSEYYKIPIIILSKVKLTENNKTFLVTNKSSDEDYYFILVLPVKANTVQEYKLFMLNKNPKINLRSVNLPIKTDIRISSNFDFKAYMRIDEPVKLKIMPKKSTVKETKKVKEDVDEDELDEEELLKALEALEMQTPKIVRPQSI